LEAVLRFRRQETAFDPAKMIRALQDTSRGNFFTPKQKPAA